MRARLCFVIAFCFSLCACGGPSLRYKKEVFDLLDKSDYQKLESKITEAQKKYYGGRNELLFYLDVSSPLFNLQKYDDMHNSLARAQSLIEDDDAISLTQQLGMLTINDSTRQYKAPLFEQALTYFYRAAAYLQADDFNDAAVEARRAVFALDNYRQHNNGLNDNPFVQYFASMIFEDTGNLSSARIARQNAQKAYKNFSDWSAAREPQLAALPKDYQDKGELVVLHLNGKIPYKISEELLFAWHDVWFAVNANNDLQGVAPDVLDAVYAGVYGNSIKISFPKLMDNPYAVKSSAFAVRKSRDEKSSPENECSFGEFYQTQLAQDIAAEAQKTLKEQLAAAFARTVTRAVTKFILSVQASNAAKNASNETAGQLVKSLLSIVNAVTEKADTRSWITLPAQIRINSVFLDEGSYDVKIIFYDGNKNPIDEHLWEKVQIKRGKRTYITFRTAK